MKVARVLVVDDSALVRQLVSAAVSAEPDLEVVGTAHDGSIVLDKIRQTNPDVIVLDIEMPDMDGLSTVQAIRADYPRLPIVMFSTLTEHGADATLQALSKGATDYATKPSMRVPPGTSMEDRTAALMPLFSELVAKVRSVAIASGRLPPNAGAAVRLHMPRSNAIRKAAPKPPQRIDAIVIGSSTGGPQALEQVFGDLGTGLGVPVLIVQHIPPVFSARLADRLDRTSRWTVREINAGEVLEPDVAYMAPGDYHLRLLRDGTSVRALLDQGPLVNSCRPAVDVLFSAAAELWGANLVAAILTGMGRDGLKGCEDIAAAGGYVIAQDEATSTVWGMPGFVAERGIADEVLPIDEIGLALTRRVNVGRLATKTAAQP